MIWAFSMSVLRRRKGKNGKTLESSKSHAEETADNESIRGILGIIQGLLYGPGMEIMLTGGMKNTPEFTAKVQKGGELCGA